MLNTCKRSDINVLLLLLSCIHQIILLGSSSLFNSSPMTAFRSTIPYASSSLHTLSSIRIYANPPWIDFVLKSINIWKPLLFHANSIFLSSLASPEQALLLSQDSFLVPTLLVDRSNIRQPFLCYIYHQLGLSTFLNRAESRRQRSSLQRTSPSNNCIRPFRKSGVPSTDSLRFGTPCTHATVGFSA